MADKLGITNYRATTIISRIHPLHISSQPAAAVAVQRQIRFIVIDVNREFIIRL